MREALTEALQDYDGALVVVAHDRHLLRATTDALWLVADGKVAPFDGDLDDYRDWVLTRGGAGAKRADATRPSGAPIARRASARRRRRGSGWPTCASRCLRGRRRSSARWRRSTQEKDALDAWLASEAAYAEDARDTLKARIARQGEITWQLARLETEWLENAEALENVRRRRLADSRAPCLRQSGAHVRTPHPLMAWPRKRIYWVAGSIVATLVVTLVVLNLIPAQKRIEHRVERLLRDRLAGLLPLARRAARPAGRRRQSHRGAAERRRDLPCDAGRDPRARDARSPSSRTSTGRATSAGRSPTRWPSARKAGVQVRVLLDWLGSQKIDDKLLDEMRDAGVEI